MQSPLLALSIRLVCVRVQSNARIQSGLPGDFLHWRYYVVLGAQYHVQNTAVLLVDSAYFSSRRLQTHLQLLNLLIMIFIRKPKLNVQTSSLATGTQTVFNGAAPTELYVGHTHDEMSRRVSA